MRTHHRALFVAATIASSLILSSCVNDPQRAIEIAHASCVLDWAPLYPPDTPEERIDDLTNWHARPDGNGWLAWTGANEKTGDTVHVSRIGPIHSECSRYFQD